MVKKQQSKKKLNQLLFKLKNILLFNANIHFILSWFIEKLNTDRKMNKNNGYILQTKQKRERNTSTHYVRGMFSGTFK